MDHPCKATMSVIHRARIKSRHDQTRCANRRRTNRIRIEEVFRDKIQSLEIRTLQELSNQVREFLTGYFHEQNLSMPHTDKQNPQSIQL